MSSSKLLLDSEISPMFQYPLRKETISEKIYKITNKIFSFIRKHQFALEISLCSYLISQAVASSLDTVSTLSTTVDNLEGCQDRLCNYWNDNIQRNENNSTVEINNLLSRLSRRCNNSDPHYKPFKSFNKCKKIWCKYMSEIGGEATDCFDSAKKLTDLWNKLCPKAEFDQLKKGAKKKFFDQCFKKICNYYKNHNKKLNFNHYCQSLELKRILQKIYKVIKDWQSESRKTESHDSGNTESTLSIIAAVISIVGGLTSIGATAFGCYVAKLTLNSLSSGVARAAEVGGGVGGGVAEGLRSIVAGSIALARRATLGYVELLNVPNQGEISRAASQSLVDTVYQDAESSFSQIEEDFREISFNFDENEEENLLEANVFQESDVVNQHLLENSVSDEVVIPYDNSFSVLNPEKVVENVGQMIQKAFTNLSSLIPDYREIIYMTRCGNRESFEMLFNSLDYILSNATKKVIQVVGAIIEPGINGSFRVNGSEKIYEYNLTYTVDYSLNYTLQNQNIFTTNNEYIFYKLYRIFGKIVKRRID